MDSRLLRGPAVLLGQLGEVWAGGAIQEPLNFPTLLSQVPPLGAPGGLLVTSEHLFPPGWNEAPNLLASNYTSDSSSCPRL